jgi:subtilisin family serine protease
MSFASGFSSALNQVALDATNAGIHVVVAAGDSATNACNVSPATVSQVIAVGATEKTSDSVIATSNTGSCVDFFAPGRDIIAAGLGADNALSRASGTGESCPHVSGAIALIISKQGNASPSTMTNNLINLSTKNILSGVNGAQNRFLFVPTP